ncbi:MAG: SDR family oxidoreductase [Fibrobacter sp.]|nr:SDR family oxidoreductase [Fibrobacter sp.]
MKRYKALLITGASAGIGKEIAYALAPQTDNIVLVARRADKLEALAKDLSVRFGVKAYALPADLSVSGSATQVFDKTIELVGRPPDLLVNDAGVGFSGEASEIPTESEVKMITLNVESLMVLCKLALKPMYARRSGVILNVASVAGFQPGPYMAAYYASKAFVLSYSEALAEEARPYGVRVLTLCPGTVDTEFHFFASSKRGYLRNLLSSSPQSVAWEAARAILLGFPERIVPGIVNKAVLLAERLLPRFVVTRLTGKFLDPRK